MVGKDGGPAEALGVEGPPDDILALAEGVGTVTVPIGNVMFTFTVESPITGRGDPGNVVSSPKSVVLVLGSDFEVSFSPFGVLVDWVEEGVTFPEPIKVVVSGDIDIPLRPFGPLVVCVGMLVTFPKFPKGDVFGSDLDVSLCPLSPFVDLLDVIVTVPESPMVTSVGGIDGPFGSVVNRVGVGERDVFELMFEVAKVTGSLVEDGRGGKEVGMGISGAVSL